MQSGLQRILEESVRHAIFEHIKQNAIKKEILVEAVNGHAEHVHFLYRLKNDQTIGKVMQLIKGESSFWVNNQKVLKHKLQWQKEYYAVSVSETQVKNVETYILNQEEHHKKKTFIEEYDKLIKAHGFQIFNKSD